MPDGTSTRIEVFEYPAGTPPPMLWEDVPEVGSAAPLAEGANFRKKCTSHDTESEDLSRASTAELAKRSFDAGREQGIREAREMAASEQSGLLQVTNKALVEQSARLASQVKNDCESFLHEAEHELVRLALAIAARILRREAQMDPLSLIGAVRVALGQLAATIQVRLRVPAAESGLWTETLAHIPNLRVKPAVIPDDSMQLGDCRIETEMGSVDLGLHAQLHQMEMALLDEEPAIKPDASINSEPEQHEVKV